MDGNNKKEIRAQAAERKLLPSETLVKALELFNKEDHIGYRAVDLGYGSGVDTIALLERGWNVTAIDKEPVLAEQLKNNVTREHWYRLEIISGSFEHVPLPQVLLLNASFSLPFCSPGSFNDLWQQITHVLVYGGRFAGHFFGVKDSWASRPEMTFHTKKQVLDFFKQFEIEYFEETQRIGKTLLGKEKHWHVFHIVAKKK